MANLRERFNHLQTSYVFRQVNEKAAAYASSHPGTSLLKMGIGNTTMPLVPSVVTALHEAVDRLANAETYTGYGDELGEVYLRQALSEFYEREYAVTVSAEEFVLSDGAKSDAANLPSIFETGITAVQDPVYPVYVESNVLAGNTLVYLTCDASNSFIPDPPEQAVDLIYICSPNNPTGTVATKSQLKRLVDYARAHEAVIIFDAAYSAFVTDTSLPRSIYEIEGARECAIEVNSFSKWAGFTGVRLGWTIIPTELCVNGSKAGDVLARWRRRQLVYFNGPSNIAQAGGLAALSPTGITECREVIQHYLHNASYIRDSLRSAGLTVFGGTQSPYVWVKTPHNMTSWELFDALLEETQVVTTPGIGFGAKGESFIRFSAFASAATVHEAMDRVAHYLRNSRD